LLNESNDNLMLNTQAVRSKRADQILKLIGTRLLLDLRTRQKEANQQQIEYLMMDSGAKERELEVLKRRVVMDTNELNQLNLKIMQVNR
jgi:hypothetical protein